MISKAWMFLGVDNGLTHIASCFDIKLISIHIGYPVECCVPLSPMATAIAHEPFSSPESISVEEVYEIFKKVF
jgi:ADP-heptose:LPS heptosyltransferase